MKYFEVFELEPRLNLDPDALQRKFHELSRRYHPDYHTNASADEKARALEMTALLNDAYRTLSDPTRRAEYLVKSQGFIVDGSKVPQAMLMEVFEINEGLEELRAARQSGQPVGSLLEDIAAFREQVRQKREAYQKQLRSAFSRWDQLLSEGGTDPERLREDRECREQLEALADIISQSSYIRNLEHELDNEVSQ